MSTMGQPGALLPSSIDLIAPLACVRPALINKNTDEQITERTYYHTKN